MTETYMPGSDETPLPSWLTIHPIEEVEGIIQGMVEELAQAQALLNTISIRNDMHLSLIALEKYTQRQNSDAVAICRNSEGDLALMLNYYGDIGKIYIPISETLYFSGIPRINQDWEASSVQALGEAIAQVESQIPGGSI